MKNKESLKNLVILLNDNNEILIKQDDDKYQLPTENDFIVDKINYKPIINVDKLLIEGTIKSIYITKKRVDSIPSQNYIWCKLDKLNELSTNSNSVSIQSICLYLNTFKNEHGSFRFKNSLLDFYSPFDSFNTNYTGGGISISSKVTIKDGKLYYISISTEDECDSCMVYTFDESELDNLNNELNKDYVDMNNINVPHKIDFIDYNCLSNILTKEEIEGIKNFKEISNDICKSNMNGEDNKYLNILYDKNEIYDVHDFMQECLDKANCNSVLKKYSKTFNLR